jgi:hypothetical protein
MEGPNQVLRVSLATGKADWKVDLDGAPSSITAVPDAAIVAVGDALYRIKDGKGAAWSTGRTGISGPVTQLATSDEGAFVYVATQEAIIAVNGAQPDAAPAALVALSGGAWLAPIPKESSLHRGGGEGTGPASSAGTGGDSGNGEGNGPSRAPATDAEGEGRSLWRRSGPDLLLLGGVGAAIVVGVLIGSRALLKRMTGEG